MKRKHLVLFWAVGISTAAFWSLGFARVVGGQNYTLHYVDNDAGTTFEANSAGSAAQNASDGKNPLGHALAVPSGGTATTFGSGVKLVAGTTSITTNADGHLSTGQTAVINCKCVDNGNDVDITLTQVSGNVTKGLINSGDQTLGAAYNVASAATFWIGGADGNTIVDPYAASIAVACPIVGNAPENCACPASCPI